MTQNQIRYIQAMEEIRANQAKEAENLRSNLAREQENIRSNQVKEDETKRSNLENERLNREKLEYEKYGKDVIGNTIRTIKAGVSEVTSDAASSPKSLGYATDANGSTNGPTLGTLDLDIGTHADDEYLNSISGMTAAKAASEWNKIMKGEKTFSTASAKTKALQALQKKVGGLI